MNRLTKANGLASNEVLNVWQDKKGFMWVGSTNGLQRFDGKRFMTFFSRINQENFSSKVIHQVTGDAAGNMWLKADAEFGIYNPANFSFHAMPVKSQHTFANNSELITDAAGNVFILYYQQGIVCYDKVAGCFADKLPFKIPAGWAIRSLFYDSLKHDYWIGCDSGLAVYNTVSQRLYYGNNNLINNPLLNQAKFSGVKTFYIDKSRNHWLVYSPGNNRLASYACYSEKEKGFVKDTSGLNNASNNYYDVRNIFETHKGIVWMYGDDIMLGRSPEQKRFVNVATTPLSQVSPKINMVYSMLEDKEHNVWAATDAGLYTFSPEMPPVTNYILKSDDGQNNFSGLQQINKQLWVSSQGKGLIIFDSTFHRVKPDKIYENYKGEKLDAAKFAWDFTQSSVTGKVWVACQQGWLQVVDPSNFSGIMMQVPAFQQSTVRQVTEDKLGHLWFGTQNGRLVTYDARQHPDTAAFKLVQQYTAPINRLYSDNLNRLWICTGGDGLYCIDATKGQLINTYSTKGQDNKKLFDNYVSDIVQINDSIFAVAATSFHLLNINTGTIKRFNYADGISSNRISGLVADAKGNIWIGTSDGICRYNFLANNFIRYGEKDGFDQTEKIGETNLLFNHNMLAMAGRNQVSVFNPNDFNAGVDPPPVVITDIKLFNAFLPVDSLRSQKSIVFNHKQHSLTFYFSSLNFVQNDKIKYFYRLEKTGQEWQQADNSLSANYTLLLPGNYIFQVRSENEQHVSSTVTFFAFQIRPPFYATWWFISLIVLLLAAELFSIYRLRRNRREAVEQMRTQVARDLHDDMGSTLSTINILSTMAEKNLQTDTLKSHSYISKIKDNSHRMMEAMDDIVWSIKPANDSMQKISGRMREFSTSVLEAKNIELQLRMDENVKNVKLNMAARRDFFLVFKEAINNIAKYSAAGMVSVHVGYRGSRLVLSIKDNGKGFDIDKADNGNGLNNMQRRADDLKARLSIQSKPGVGTQVVLNMPVK